MFARVHTLETTPEQDDQGLRVVTEEILPWLRDSTGFRGLIRLASRATGQVLTVSLWATEESLRNSAEAARQISELSAAGVGATLLAVTEYEVTMFDVQP